MPFANVRLTAFFVRARFLHCFFKLCLITTRRTFRLCARSDFDTLISAFVVWNSKFLFLHTCRRRVETSGFIRRCRMNRRIYHVFYVPMKMSRMQIFHANAKKIVLSCENDISIHIVKLTEKRRRVELTVSARRFDRISTVREFVGATKSEHYRSTIRPTFPKKRVEIRRKQPGVVLVARDRDGPRGKHRLRRGCERDGGGCAVPPRGRRASRAGDVVGRRCVRVSA